MPAWVKCERCKKVKPGDDFEGDSLVCTACLTAPVKAAPRARASAVSTRRSTVVPPAAPVPPGPRPALLGVAGAGDLEVRERRARRTALDQLVETYTEDFEHLLQAARRAEGLRV